MSDLLDEIIVKDEAHNYVDEVWLELSHPECKALSVSLRVKRNIDSDKLEDNPEVTCNELWAVTSHRDVLIVSALFLKAANIIEDGLQKYRDAADDLFKKRA